MREFINLLTAVAVLAIVQAFTAALWVALLILAMMAAVAFPRQTFALAVLIGLLVLAFKAPAVCAIALGIFGIVTVVKSRHQPRPTSASSPVPLLTYRRPTSTNVGNQA